MELLVGDGKGRLTRQETELNYRGFRYMASCTHYEVSIQAVRNIASLLSMIFLDRDLVTSDILAALLLRNHELMRNKESLKVKQGG